MSEIWKNIPGYENLYKVSNLGNVKRFYKNGKKKILKPLSNRDGYFQVALCKDGNVKYYKIHRLVASAFLPNPENLPEVNHRDENKLNNSTENLEWISSKDNCNFGSRNERIAKAKSKPVYQYSKDKQKLIKEWSSVKEINQQLGYNCGNISQCCLGKLNSANGYYWSHLKL